MVLGLCRSLVRDPHEADDAFQATFWCSFARPDRSRPSRHDRSLAPWCGRPGRTARARHRSMLRQKREVATNEEIPCPVRLTVESPSPEEIIHDEISRLPTSFRTPVVLCCLEGLTYHLAAQRLGVTEATLRGRLHRARKRLAARLSGRGITAGTFSSVTEPARLTLPTLASALVESTVQFAVRWSSVTGLLSGVAVVPESIAGLAQGVIKTMMLQSLKFSGIGVLMAAGVLGTVVVAQQGQNAGTARECSGGRQLDARQAGEFQTGYGPETAATPACHHSTDSR